MRSTIPPQPTDRAAFSYGIEQLDKFFKKAANNTRIYVMTSANVAVIGFYALDAHAIDYQDLPKKFARSRPSHGSPPAATLSMIDVD